MASDHHLNEDGIELIPSSTWLSPLKVSPFSTASCLSVFLVAKFTCEVNVEVKLIPEFYGPVFIAAVLTNVGSLS